MRIMTTITVLSLLVLFSNSASANFAEMFGGSTTTAAVGNQANGDATDAGNVFYIPALMAFHDKTTVSLTGTTVKTNFHPITNIVTDNSRTSPSATAGNPIVGDVNTDYQAVNNTAISFNLPLAHNNGNVAFTVLAPIGSLMEFNSGDPNSPEYVMHRARYKRTHLYGNFAKKFGDSWAWSVGFLFGIQSAGDAESLNEMNSNSTSNVTSAGMKVKAQATLAGSFSIAKKFEKSLAYFSYQQEMKSNTEVRAHGTTTQPTPIPYDLTYETLTFFDPHIFRLGYVMKNFSKFHILTSIEYQIWDNYKTPIIRIKRNSGSSILGSDSLENLKVRNILIPHLGTNVFITEKLTLSAGLFYRPSPLEGDFSGAGNSIDSDTFVATAGGSYDISLWGMNIELASSLQYHKMKDITVTITSGEEDGSTGRKIGDGGYTVGGEIYVLSFGANIQF